MLTEYPWQYRARAHSSTGNIMIDNLLENEILTYVVVAVLLILVGIATSIIVRIIVKKLKIKDILAARKLTQKIHLLIPGLLLYFAVPLLPKGEYLLEKIISTYVLAVMALVVLALLDVLNDYYTTFTVSKSRPIKGFVQVGKILVMVIFGIAIVANFLGKSPFLILGSLGATVAVFSFVFKDMILGLVAGVQLTSNDMLRIGDWIEVDKYKAEGTVTELSLTSVKIEGFDKSIYTMPTYGLINDSFKNWRGMQEAGGRRIKRPIYIDVATIKFCDDELLERLKKLPGLKDYIEEKQAADRTLTNVGTFRIYIENYIRNSPDINKNMTLMVRQLPPGETGLPLEIYAFAASTKWEVYERIQSDIFDHVMAIVGEFDLALFQRRIF